MAAMPISPNAAERAFAVQGDLILQCADVDTIRRLSAVSRAFAAMAQQRLFRCLRIGYLAARRDRPFDTELENESVNMGVPPVADQLRCTQLMDLITRKPYMAESVRGLDLVVRFTILPELVRMFDCLRGKLKALEIEWFVILSDRHLEVLPENSYWDLDMLLGALARCNKIESVHLHYSHRLHFRVLLSGLSRLKPLRYLIVDTKYLRSNYARVFRLGERIHQCILARLHIHAQRSPTSTNPGPRKPHLRVRGLPA